MEAQWSGASAIQCDVPWRAVAYDVWWRGAWCVCGGQSSWARAILEM
jgi:hypothetical protein